MIALVLPDHDRRDSWLEGIEEFAGATLHGSLALVVEQAPAMGIDRLLRAGPAPALRDQPPARRVSVRKR